MSLTADQIVKLFEKDSRARKRLAELMVLEPDVRLAIINAVLRDVATKQDIEALRKEMRAEISELKAATKQDIESLREATKQDIETLRKEIKELKDHLNGLSVRVGKLESSLSLFIKIFFAVNVPILLGIIGILLKNLFP